MTFTFIDLILVILVVAFVLFGLYFGLIHTVGSVVGALLAVVAAGYALPYVTDWLNAFMTVGPILTVIIFLVLFMVVSRFVGFVFYLLESTLGIVARLPFIHSIDRLLGGVLGFVEGVIVSGVLIHVALTYLNPGSFTAALSISTLANWITSLTDVLVAWLPF